MRAHARAREGFGFGSTMDKAEDDELQALKGHEKK